MRPIGQLTVYNIKAPKKATCFLIRDVCREMDTSICVKHRNDIENYCAEMPDIIWDCDDVYLPVIPIDDILDIFLVLEPEVRTVAIENAFNFGSGSRVCLTIQTLLLAGYDVILSQYEGDLKDFIFNEGDDV